MPTNTQLEKLLKQLEARLTKLEEIKPIIHTDNPIANVVPAVSAPTSTLNPIPVEYRKIVDEVLNKDFGINLNYSGDLPQFSFEIIIPDEFCSLTLQEKLIRKVDLRTKIIKYAEGSNGVKEWAERVFNSFAPELKAKIIMQR